MNELTEKQRIFIWRAFADKKKYDDICAEIGATREELKTWTVELKPHWQKVAGVKDLYVRKKLTLDFKRFYQWFTEQEQVKSCYYCEIPERDLVQMIDKKLIETKRLRGRKLELDRKVPDKLYDELDNLVWSCYWCNNAKTDTFTEAEFKEIAKGIKKVWENRLKQASLVSDQTPV